MLIKTRVTLLIIVMIIMFITAACGNPLDKGDTGSINLQEQLYLNYVMPEETGEADGLSNFTTLDVYGETVTQNVFSDYDLTMVNVWGTFCSPCLKEMPDLGEIHEEYEDDGFNIIGIVVDVQTMDGSIDEDVLYKAMEIISDTGASYTHLIPSANINSGMLDSVQYIPYTVFVDSEGKIVGDEIIGSRSKEEWIEIIESMF